MQPLPTDSSTTLEFRAVTGDKKFEHLSEADFAGRMEQPFSSFLNGTFPQGDRSTIKVLDFGCGRGTLVGMMRNAGWAAYGADIDERFVDSGKILSERWPSQFPVLSCFRDDGRTIFPDGYFDAILSDQVIEHVENLDMVAAEMARLLKPNGALFLRFPGRRRPIEPHYFLPLVHWLPKSLRRTRRAAARLFTAMGLGVKFLVPLKPAQKAEIICTYAERFTHYRSPGEITRIFSKYGIQLDFGTLFQAWFVGRLRDVLKFPRPALALTSAALRSRTLCWTLGDLSSWLVSGKKMA